MQIIKIKEDEKYFDVFETQNIPHTQIDVELIVFVISTSTIMSNEEKDNILDSVIDALINWGVLPQEFDCEIILDTIYTYDSDSINILIA